MFIKTEQIETPKIYNLLVNGIIPRPIAWISTIDKKDNSNLAPYSFFSVASVNPPVLTITSVPSTDKAAKDTLQNLIDTKEAVVHIVTEEHMHNMNASCANYPAGHSEIEAIGIETIPSEIVSPPAIANTKIRYECRLNQVINIAEQPGGGILIGPVNQIV